MSRTSGKNNKKTYPRTAKTRKVAARGAANLFGFHAVEAAWRNPERKIKRVFVTESAWQSFEKRFESGRAPMTDPKRPAPEFLTRKEIDKILPHDVHQGIAVEADPLPEIYLADILIAKRQSQDSMIIMLDQVTDPHNVGAILRSASVFGADALVQQTRHAPLPEGVLAKTASGAVEYVPLVYETNLSDAIEALKRAGYHVFGLDERGEDLNRVLTKDHNTSQTAKNVLVLGAEGKGLRPKLRDLCDNLLKIPSSGEVTALNVSNAAAIGLYALKEN